MCSGSNLFGLFYDDNSFQAFFNREMTKKQSMQNSFTFHQYFSRIKIIFCS